MSRTMFELTTGLFGLGIAAQSLGWTVVSLLYPLFVVWMIVDAVLRDESKPGGLSSNDRLIWVILMVVANPAAFVYFLIVYRPARSAQRAAGAGYAPTV